MHQIIHKPEDIAYELRMLHKQQELAICIIDKGSDQQSKDLLNYINSSFNAKLYFAIEDDKIRLSRFDDFYKIASFIVYDQEMTSLVLTKIALEDCKATYLLILDARMSVDKIDIQSLMDLLAKDKELLAISPIIKNRLKENIPSISVPTLFDNQIQSLNFFPSSKTLTLYPFLGVALYNRALFERLKLVDPNIKSEYWQLMDLGFSTYLFGYKILSHPSFICSFLENIIEDRSDAPGLDRLYTKALCVRQDRGKNRIKKFGKYSNSKYLKTIEKKISLYKIDIFKLIDNWQVE